MSLALTFVLGFIAAPSSLDAGARLLADYRADEALRVLERARGEGPYGFSDHLRLYELLGTAYAYLDRPDDARKAFDMLLALDPGRAISYTLSPKVTFSFEQARGRAADRAPPTVDLRWPLDLSVDDEIPIEVDVVSDPKAFLRHGQLFTRLEGQERYERLEFPMPTRGASHRVLLPALARGLERRASVELHLIVLDAAGNEVYRLGSPQRPRSLALRWDLPDPWYSRWWVWALAGTLVAAGASGAVFAATRDPGPFVDGRFRGVP